MNRDYDGLAAYARLGWVPCDLENESVSKTLEYAYDDYCIARMAKALGKKDDYAYFMKRAASYKNLFDPSIGLMRAKDSHGKWRTPFNPHALRRCQPEQRLHRGHELAVLLVRAAGRAGPDRA